MTPDLDHIRPWRGVDPTVRPPHHDPTYRPDHGAEHWRPEVESAIDDRDSYRDIRAR